MNRNYYIICLMATLLLALVPASTGAAETPDVLYIVIDDLNDWVGCLGGHPQAKTPNLDRLAARGTLFTRANCVAPACLPSRTAVALGKRPSTTGVFLNEGFQNTPRRDVLRESLPLSGMFRKSGYETVGGGKLNYIDQWDINFKRPNDPAPDKQTNGDLLKAIEAGPLDVADSEMGDYKLVDWAAAQLAMPREKPLFLGVGFVKPHLPLYVPKHWFDLHPLESVKLPEDQENDLADLPPAGVAMAKKEIHKKILQHGEWQRAVQAYLATISFVDAQVGRLLDAAERRASKRDLIIVLWSDHGWNLGEKEHWQKFALWEGTTRAPFLFVVPGVTKAGSRCERPVDFLSIYPTLAEICGLEAPEDLEGASLLPLLRDPSAAWDRPAMTSWGRGNHAMRTDHFRFIRYADGGEELYDHRDDPNEWKNLANNPEFAGMKKKLARFFPTSEAPAPNAEEMKRAREEGKRKGAKKGK